MTDYEYSVEEVPVSPWLMQAQLDAEEACDLAIAGMRLTGFELDAITAMTAGYQREIERQAIFGIEAGRQA